MCCLAISPVICVLKVRSVPHHYSIRITALYPCAELCQVVVTFKDRSFGERLALTCLIILFRTAFSRVWLVPLFTEEKVTFFINLLVFEENKRVVRVRQVSYLQVKKKAFLFMTVNATLSPNFAAAN